MRKEPVRSDTILLAILKELVTKVGVMTVKNKDPVSTTVRRWAKTIEMLNVAES